MVSAKVHTAGTAPTSSGWLSTWPSGPVMPSSSSRFCSYRNQPGATFPPRCARARSHSQGVWATAQGQPLAEAASGPPASPTTENAEQARSGCRSLNYRWGNGAWRGQGTRPRSQGSWRRGSDDPTGLPAKLGVHWGLCTGGVGGPPPQAPEEPLNLPGAPMHLHLRGHQRREEKNIKCRAQSSWAPTSQPGQGEGGWAGPHLGCD